jgi:hypothetical protein
MNSPLIEQAMQQKAEPKDSAMAVITAGKDIEEELKPMDLPVINSRLNPATQTFELQLVSAGNIFSGVSIEDAISRGLGAESTYFEWYKATAELRKPVNLIAAFATRCGFETTISCVDKNDDPENEEYLRVKTIIDELNRRVNMDNVLYVSIIKKLIYGRAGWQITTGSNTNKIMSIDPLYSPYVYPRVDGKTGVFLGVDYAVSGSKFIPNSRLLYFTNDTFEADESSWKGISAFRSVEREVKIKKNLQRDLLYAARSLWAPIVIYSVDTRGLTPEEKANLFADLKQDLKPGAIVVTNKPVEPKVVQYQPDLNNLIRAIENQEQAIIGNFGIPKALLSREKTETRATLEFSIQAFYESTISQEQTYIKRQLERQWYDPLVKLMGYGDKIHIRHEWKPILSPDSLLITALTVAVEKGVISIDEFYRRLGWEVDRVETDAKPIPEKKEVKEDEKIPNKKSKNTE